MSILLNKFDSNETLLRPSKTGNKLKRKESNKKKEKPKKPKDWNKKERKKKAKKYDFYSIKVFYNLSITKMNFFGG